MSPPRPRHGRKILVASIGVASMTYVISCGGGTSNNGDAAPPDGEARDVKDEFPIANLVARPDTGTKDASVDSIDEFPVANLVAADVGPRDATVDTIDDFPVANLVVRPDTGIKDAKTKDTIDDFPVANLVVRPDK